MRRMAGGVLARAGIHAHVPAPTCAQLVDELRDGAGALLLAEEVLADARR